MIGPVAMAWRRAGFCSVPVRSDGTKAPGLNEWKDYQKRLPNDVELKNWWSNPNRQGFGLIMGAVSGNAEMLELEGRMMDRLPEVFVVLKECGLDVTFTRLWTGYRELTPGGGIHLIFRLSDGPALGNTKLARSADNEVLIETRGEGGFSVTAPSNGTTHPSGGSWTVQAGSWLTVPTITCAERDALYSALSSFDELQLQPKVAGSLKSVSHESKQGNVFSQSGHVSPLDQFNADASWADILIPHGWTHSHLDDAGTAYWIRPGKDTPGFSATTGRSDTGDRLYVFSTSTQFEAETPMSKAFVHAALNHGGDIPAARAALYDAGFGDRKRIREDAVSDPSDFDGMALPDEFWESRPELTHIRDAAWAQRCMPDAVLASTFGLLLAHVSPSVKLSGQSGGEWNSASLNTMAVVVGAPGTGKSQAMTAAEQILEIANLPRTDFNEYSSHKDAYPEPERGDVPTGQGMTRLFQTSASGKEKYGSRTAFLAYLDIDEGAAMANNLSNEKANPIPNLCKAWFGKRIAATNQGETRSRVQPDTYRLSIALNIQPKNAGWLTDDNSVNTGLAQRLTWFLGYKYPGRTLPAERPEHPGKLTVKLPTECFLVLDEERSIELDPTGKGPSWVPAGEFTILGVSPVEQREMDEREDFLDGGGQFEELDVHAFLMRRKVAGALCLLRGDLSVNDEDWALAGMVLHASQSTRTWVMSQVIEELARQGAQNAKTRGRHRHIENEMVSRMEGDSEEELADAIIEFVRSNGPSTLRSLKRGPGQRKGALMKIEALAREMVEHGRLTDRLVVRGNGAEVREFMVVESE